MSTLNRITSTTTISTTTSIATPLPATITALKRFSGIDLLGSAIPSKRRPAGSESIKISETLLAYPHLFVCERGLDQYCVHAIRKSNSAAALSYSSRVGLGVRQAPSSSRASAISDAVDQSPKSSYPSRAVIKRYLNEVHRYLTANGHTSKSTGIPLSMLCAVHSITKLKPSASFKAAEALKSRPQTFCVLTNHLHGSQPLIHALVPYDASAADEGIGAPIGSVDSSEPRGTELEAADADQSMRTVFVSQVSTAASRHDIEVLFSQAGPVSYVDLICNFASKQSEGRAYVVMRSLESVPRALALNGQFVLGLPLTVESVQGQSRHNDQAGEKRMRDS